MDTEAFNALISQGNETVERLKAQDEWSDDDFEGAWIMARDLRRARKESQDRLSEVQRVSDKLDRLITEADASEASEAPLLSGETQRVIEEAKKVATERGSKTVTFNDLVGGAARLAGVEA